MRYLICSIIVSVIILPFGCKKENNQSKSIISADCKKLSMTPSDEWKNLEGKTIRIIFGPTTDTYRPELNNTMRTIKIIKYQWNTYRGKKVYSLFTDSSEPSLISESFFDKDAKARGNINIESWCEVVTDKN